MDVKLEKSLAQIDCTNPRLLLGVNWLPLRHVHAHVYMYVIIRTSISKRYLCLERSWTFEGFACIYYCNLCMFDDARVASAADHFLILSRSNCTTVP